LSGLPLSVCLLPKWHSYWPGLARRSAHMRRLVISLVTAAPMLALGGTAASAYGCCGSGYGYGYGGYRSGYSYYRPMFYGSYFRPRFAYGGFYRPRVYGGFYRPRLWGGRA